MHAQKSLKQKVCGRGRSIELVDVVLLGVAGPIELVGVAGPLS